MLTERDKKNHHVSFWVQAGAALFVIAILYFVSKFKVKNKTDIKLINSKAGQIIKQKSKMKNQEYIDQLNPAVKDDFVKFIKDIEKLGYVVVITSGYRSFQRQAELKKEDPKNAAPGFSSHNYGTALDFVLYKDGKMIGKGNQYQDQWKKSGVPELAKNKYGMRWGGDFPGYPDSVHFDFNNKYGTKHLYELALKRFGSPEMAKGNELDLTA